MKTCVSFLLALCFTFSVFAADQQATAILLDVSRSIPSDDFRKAKEAIREISETSGTTTLYAFGSDMKLLDPDELSGLQATESYTMIYDAAYDAAQDLASRQADRKAVIIISDGYDTRSVTILEDIVSYVNTQGIAIYGIGIGKANRKVLERMARLTGGKYFGINHSNLVQEMSSSFAIQKAVPKKEEPKTVVIQQPAAPLSASQPVQPVTTQEGATEFPYTWVAVLLLGGVVLTVVVFLVVRSNREQLRSCPTCGRRLDPYQTVCPSCAVPETQQLKAPRPPSDGTQEIVGEQQVDPFPLELLEKKPVTEEMLSKTFVLMETPMLVVRKGKNLGQTYSLNRAFPVSIGRSRVNEIRLDDITISGQHCRVIPENGRHILCDLNSTNGTYLNDKKVTRSILKEGDTIRVGETQFLYKIEQHRT